MSLKSTNKNTSNFFYEDKRLKKSYVNKKKKTLSVKRLRFLELGEKKSFIAAQMVKQKVPFIKLTSNENNKTIQKRNKWPSKDIVLIYCIKGIISRDQLHSAYKIRRAFRLITDGTQMRVTQYKDPLLRQSSFQEYDDNPHDILMQDLYADWVDEMTVQKYPVGAILDILIDEMSLSSICKKWRKRNGWAKDILQKSLDIYRDVYIQKIG